MIIRETAKFSKLWKKIRDEAERQALKSAILSIAENPQVGKKHKGELEHLRSYAYSVRGQARRIISLSEKDAVTLFSFGPRQGI